MVKQLVWLTVFCLGLAASAWAQDEAPQVLTSDLALRQEISTSSLTVNFVIVDDDEITKVTIDGEEQEIIPGDTVLITKEFNFTIGRHIIRVTVEDEKGNKRERSYLVAYGVPVELTAEEKKKRQEIKFGVVFEVRYEVDDNPTQDLSLPFSVSDIGDLEGVVDDSEQEDNRTVLKALVSGSRGSLSGYLGVVDTSYDKADNKLLNSQVFFLGGTKKFGAAKQILMGASFSDVNLGGNDYAQQFTVTPGYEFKDKDGKVTITTVYSLDVTSKSFADTATRKDTTEYAIKRSSLTQYSNKLSTHKTLIALGRKSEGTAESEFIFFRSDLDMKHKWDSGIKWDIGFGYQYRDYPNDKDILTDELFGDTRVDNILHFKTGAGMEFGKLTLMLNYKYTTDLSNDSPYVRQIYGLSLQGIF